MHVKDQLLNRLADTFRRFDHAFGIGFDKAHHKFFATVTGDNIDIPADFAANGIGNALNHHVTNRMTVGIVHTLKVVDIHHQYANVVLLAVGTDFFGT